MLCRASADIEKAAADSYHQLFASFVNSLSERQSAPAQTSCLLPISSCVSVYRPSSVQPVPPPYHRCHCWRRHQRHQRPLPRTNYLCRRFGVKISWLRSTKNVRLPWNMLAKWQQTAATINNEQRRPFCPDDVGFVYDSKCREKWKRPMRCPLRQCGLRGCVGQTRKNNGRIIELIWI